MTGVSVRRICTRKGMPDRRTLYRWRRDPKFDRAFRAAQFQGWQRLHEDVVADVDEMAAAGVPWPIIKQHWDYRRQRLTLVSWNMAKAALASPATLPGFPQAG
jgi:hypothetical protein